MPRRRSARSRTGRASRVLLGLPDVSSRPASRSALTTTQRSTQAQFPTARRIHHATELYQSSPYAIACCRSDFVTVSSAVSTASLTRPSTIVSAREQPPMARVVSSSCQPPPSRISAVPNRRDYKTSRSQARAEIIRFSRGHCSSSIGHFESFRNLSPSAILALRTTVTPSRRNDFMQRWLRRCHFARRFSRCRAVFLRADLRTPGEEFQIDFGTGTPVVERGSGHIAIWIGLGVRDLKRPQAVLTAWRTAARPFSRFPGNAISAV